MKSQALACNRRYLDALAVVDDPAPAYQELRQLTEPKVVAKRSFAGFNPARREDVRLFAAVLDGDHIARGFRNKDIRTALFGADAKPSSRHSAAVGRLLKRLHVRQLLAKIPRTRRWRVTARGRHPFSHIKAEMPAPVGSRAASSQLRTPNIQRLNGACHESNRKNCAAVRVTGFTTRRSTAWGGLCDRPDLGSGRTCAAWRGTARAPSGHRK